MNKFNFFLKFIINKHNQRKYNWNLLLPFFGVIIGCMTVTLTLSIMEGMEYAIFTKLKNISFPGKLVDFSTQDDKKIREYLNRQNIQNRHGIEEKIILLNNTEFRLVTIHAVEHFNNFKIIEIIFLK